jgi:hypothetical protein
MATTSDDVHRPSMALRTEGGSRPPMTASMVNTSDDAPRVWSMVVGL